LGTPLGVIVGRYSGASGIAWKINELFKLTKNNWISKNDPRILLLNEHISNLYESGRVTAISDKEMYNFARTFIPELKPRTESSFTLSSMEKVAIKER
jgi:hypothetical protein